jgi:hypothetical protein
MEQYQIKIIMQLVAGQRRSLFCDHKFIVGCVLMIGAGVYSEHGCNLWQAGGGSSKKGEC